MDMLDIVASLSHFLEVPEMVNLGCTCKMREAQCRELITSRKEQVENELETTEEHTKWRMLIREIHLSLN